MDLLVLGWLTLELTGSPFMVAVAAFCRAAPLMALGPVAGLVLDRVHAGRVLVASQSAALAVAAALAALFGTGRGAFTPLLVLEVGLGIAWAIDFTTRRTIIYAVAGPSRVASAVPFETVSMQLAKMAGPVAGGVLLAQAGAAACYAMIALLHLVAAGFALALRTDVPPPRPPAQLEAAGLAAGLAEAWRRRTVRGVLLITVTMNVLVFPYQQMLPVFARDVFRVGPALLGLLLAADGVGALTGALLVAARRGRLDLALVFGAGSLGAAVILLAFALSPVYAAGLVLLLALGAAESGFATMQTTIVLLAAPDALRGRMMGILSACIGTGPFGTLLIGFAASLAGAPGAVAVAAGAALLLMLPVGGPMILRAGRPPDATR